MLKEGKEAGFFDNCIPIPPQEERKDEEPPGKDREEEMGFLF